MFFACGCETDPCLRSRIATFAFARGGRESSFMWCQHLIGPDWFYILSTNCWPRSSGMVFNIYKSVDVVQFTRQQYRLRIARHVIARSSLKGQMKYETFDSIERITSVLNAKGMSHRRTNDTRIAFAYLNDYVALATHGHCCVCSGSRNLSFDAISTIYFSTWIGRPATWDVRGARAFRMHVGNWVNLKYAHFA